MYCGLSEKSTPAAPEGLVRSVQGPPTIPREPAWPATAANAFVFTAPLGARRWDVNQSAASAASWLSCPVTSCGPIALPADAGARLPATRTAAEENKKRSRRMHPPPEETARRRAPTTDGHSGVPCSETQAAIFRKHSSQSQVGAVPAPPTKLRRVFDLDSLSGVLVALASPVTRDGAIDEAAAARLVDHVLAGGVHGVLALGSTGETASL